MLGRAYLFAYNVLSAGGWTFVLSRTLTHLSSGPTPAPLPSPKSFLGFLKKPSILPRIWVPSIVPAHLVPLYQRACTAYDVVGHTTAFVQSAAILEVLHVYFGLVRSPMPTTAMRVASRLFSVWFIPAGFLSVRCLSLP
jgi:very-long-chain (3R)-3-hydroxyacyl-CoA dehydratase